MKSKQLKLLTKSLLGVALVIYVIKSKMVDFEHLGQVLYSPRNLLIGFGFLTSTVICCALRWFLLVRAQGLSLSLKHLVELTMIGNFFNAFMPGSVGGDLIKGWYVAGRQPQAKTRAILTVFLDRAIGLSVIVFYAAFTLIFSPQWLDKNPQLRITAYAVWGFTIAALLFGTVFYLSRYWSVPIVKRWLNLARRYPTADKLIGATLVYRDHLGSVCLSVVFSTISIFGLNLFFWIQGNVLEIQTGMAEYFFIVPIALTVSALPLLPGGIGTGQIAFYTLFTWMGIPDPEKGGTLCTLVQIYMLLYNSMGIFFYIRFRRHPKLQPQQDGPPPLGASF